MMRTRPARRPPDRATSGATVDVCGWVARRRDHGGVVFLDVRDAAGHRAGGRRPRPARRRRRAPRRAASTCVRVDGTVRARPEGTVNADLPTGEIEVAATALEVLNEAEPPPFPLDDRVDVDEMLRLRHRYLDLRRAAAAAQPAHARAR